MHELIEELLEFHRTKARALMELGSIAEELLANEGHARARLKELFESFESDSERAHHHNEEQILVELRKTGAPIHGSIEDMAGEHLAFHRIVVQIIEMIEDSSSEAGTLTARIRSFVSLYDNHAGNEEAIFFPMANETLSQPAWRRVRKQWWRA